MRATILFLLLVFSSAICFGQKVDFVNNDSLQKTICKVWEMKYGVVGGMEMSPKEGVNMLVISFLPNNKVKLSSTGGKEAPTTQDWRYNPKLKYISIIRNKKEYARIVEANNDQLVLVIIQNDSVPSDIGEMKFYLIPSNRKL